MSADEKSPTTEHTEDTEVAEGAEGDRVEQSETADGTTPAPTGEDAAVTEDAGDTEATEDATPAEPSATSPRRNATVLIVATLAVLLVASAAATAWLYFTQYRPDQLTGATAQAEVLEAAKTGTLAALTYSPDDLDGDLATAKSHMTGDFLSYYTTFTDDVVRKAVEEKKVTTNAEVMRAAVSEMNPDSAKVLLFVNQTTVSADRPDPSMAASSVLVTMTKVDGDWLISAFDPV